MKKALSVLAILVLGVVIFTGQKIDNDSPRWSQISSILYPDGKYVQLPNQPDRVVTFSDAPRYINSPSGVLAVNPSVRVLPSTSVNQAELYLASNKANRNVMFGSSNSVNGSSINSGCFVTTDNGSTWGGYQVINSGNPNDQRGDPGPVVDKNMRFVFSHLVSASNFGGLTGMGANYSTNYGANFSSTWMLETNTQVDKNLSGTDDSPTSPFYGNSYTVWCTFTPIASRFSRTTNGGVTWDPFVTMSTGLAGHYVQGHDVAAGPNGEVYSTWVSNMNSGQFIADYLGFAKSTNGGVNFTSLDNAVDVNGARNSSFGGWGIRVNDFPRIDVDKSGGVSNGWIYIVLMEINHSPAGTDEDVVLYRSSNQGTTWMPGVRVNQDALNNGKRQFFPAVKVDDFGGVNVIYYDNRNFPNADSATVMMSRSIDGGATFTDIELSDHHFKPKPQLGMGGGYMGDYIGIAIGNNKVFGFWMDDKAGAAGFYNAWTASLDLGPAISHTNLGNTEQTTGTRAVNCIITPSGSPITPSTVKLYYSLNNPTLTSNVTMTNTSGNNWTANLPMSGAGLYRYYITATDAMSRTATYPGGAPANTVQFTASPDTVKPVIVTTPLGDVPKTTWPVSVSASVTDNIGVDSVWVKWYKNNTGTGIKQFRLLVTTGSNFAAAFNSLPADVNFNDSIFYRVFARDNSSGHNADSTALYKFKIINLTNVCIGTGTTSSNYPYTTFWMDGRTQMLFTAAELNAAGIGVNSAFTKIGFNVLTASAQAMSGFNVKFQATAQTSLTGFVTTGTWFTGFSGSYTVPGTGIQDITMTNPYLWNGTSNVIIEICYDNAAYTSYSTVASTAAAGKTWGYYTDNSTGCTMVGGAVQANRPNVCFTFTSGVGVNPIGSELPKVYSLSQNYPNPFNPVTKINFALPKQGLVTLKIYDVLGREVRTLVNEVKSVGTYSVDFNASEFSSGVYFYKLESEGFSDIKRMMLIK